MIEVNKANFEEEVLKAEGLVMVDFWSPSCEPCKELLPDVHQLAEKYAGQAKFCSLDTTGNKRLAISQKVLGLPTIATLGLSSSSSCLDESGKCFTTSSSISPSPSIEAADIGCGSPIPKL